MKIRVTNSVFLLFVFFFVALLIFLFASGYRLTKSCTTDYKWINAQLRCQEKPVVSKTGYVQLKNKLMSDIEKLKQEGRVQEVGIFFRDLHNGPTLGINDRDGFIPASLLKVPIMLTLFKLAEEDRSILAKPLIYSSNSAELSVAQTVPDDFMLEQDKPYTVDELIFRMVAYSDNHSTRVLEAYLHSLSPGKDLVEETYFDLGLLDPADHTPGDTLSVKSYASLFRLLYNSSYLSKELSEKALYYLSRSEFKGGIAGGVPENVKVAHKFGHNLETGTAELHDCGIIYYPENPYLLCVMTKGVSEGGLESVLQEISTSVWEEVSSRQL